MQKIALEYCRIIECAGCDGKENWLVECERLLPALQQSIVILLPAQIEKNHPMTPNFERRFELFTELREKLGKKDHYKMMDGMADENLLGSLADDLTDIYCELKYGLIQLEQGHFTSKEAKEHWANSYHLHWGQHLVDAIRYLYELRISGKIES